MALDPNTLMNPDVDLAKTGYGAIQPPKVSGPTARRKLVTGPDGVAQVVYVDTTTGQELQNLAGYQIVEGGGQTYADLDSLGLSPTSQPKDDKPTIARETIKNVQPRVGEGGRDTSRGIASSGSRAQNNNFGYVNQPGLLGVAAFAPGPIGMAAKAAKAGINMNNNAAINAARESMDLPGQGLGASIKGMLSDQKGKVADVKIGDAQYTVGLEALDKQGKTTMTPDEANKRAQANAVKIDLASPDEVAAKQREFDDAWGEDKGLIGGFTSKVGSFLDNIFGREQETPAYQQYDQAKHEAIRSQNSGSNFSPTDSGFADMLGASPVSGASRSVKGKVSTGGASRSSGGGSSAGSGKSNPGTSGHMGAGGGTTSGHGPGIGSA